MILARADIAGLLEPQGLMISGVVASDLESIVLVSPDEPRFWGVITASPEFQDGLSDPIDRWSKRVLSDIANRANGVASFPSDGPPFAPFYSWALASGRAHPSPLNLLVHDVAGLFISYRGAIRLPYSVGDPPTISPCVDCVDQPCRSACPVGALTPNSYDVPACRAYLDQPEGQGCLTTGCACRRACPVGAERRLPEQSAYHMRQFHK